MVRLKRHNPYLYSPQNKWEIQKNKKEKHKAIGFRRTDIEKEVNRALYENGGLTKEDLQDVSIKLEQLGLDSLDLIETTMDLEDAFEITLNDDFLIDETKTINDIVNELYFILNGDTKPRFSRGETTNTY